MSATDAVDPGPHRRLATDDKQPMIRRRHRTFVEARTTCSPALPCMAVTRSSTVGGRRATPSPTSTSARRALPMATDCRGCRSCGDTHVLMAGPKTPRRLVSAAATVAPDIGLVSPLAERFRLVAPDTIGQPGLSAAAGVGIRRSLGFGRRRPGPAGTRPAAATACHTELGFFSVSRRSRLDV